MANLEDLIPYILPDMPKAPRSNMVHMIRLALIEFCEKTMYYRHDMTAFDFTNATPTVTLTAGTHLPAATRLVKIHRLMWKLEREIEPAVKDDLDRLDPGWEKRTGDNPVQYVKTTDREIIRWDVIPDATTANAITGSVSVKPLLSATTLPDNIMEDYGEGIAAGAKYRLSKMRSKPWYDPDFAQVHYSEFTDECDKAKTVAEKMFAQNAKRRTSAYYY